MFSGVPPWIAASRSGAGAPGTTIAEVVNGSANQGAYWNLNDNSKMGQLSTDTPGNVVNGNNVGLVEPTAGVLKLQEPGATQRPIWQSNAGVGRIYFDGVGDGLTIYGVTGNLAADTSVFIVFERNAGSRFQMVQRAGIAHYFWKAKENETVATHYEGFGGAMTFRRNGAAYTLTKEGDVYADAGTGKVLLTAQNSNWSAYGTGAIEFADSGYAGYDTNGWIYDIVVVSGITEGDRAVIEAELAAKHSITLP